MRRSCIERPGALAGRARCSRTSGVKTLLVRPRGERCVARAEVGAAAAPAAVVAQERAAFVLFSELPSLAAVDVEGRAAVPAGGWGERGIRCLALAFARGLGSPGLAFAVNRLGLLSGLPRAAGTEGASAH